MSIPTFCPLRTLTWYRFLVFHGGSGSTKEEITTAVQNGVVKMNVDTGLSFHLFIVDRNVDLASQTPNSPTWLVLE